MKMVQLLLAIPMQVNGYFQIGGSVFAQPVHSQYKHKFNLYDLVAHILSQKFFVEISFLKACLLFR